ncbi:MAG: sigma-70 family RNA polymerase sigma factor [Hymenobacteraceae bacterium]|nr:sigma-70 family RNA polymerase sigma factor [Hymenobacteraceae bacterium]
METKCDVPAFWLEYKDMVRDYILKQVKNEALAQDLTQEVLLKVYRFCHTRSGVKNKRSWLFEISRNTIVDHYRRESKTESYETLTDTHAPSECTDVYESMSDYIRPLLCCLPEMYARPLQLDMDGVDQKEIARRLDLELPTAKSRVQRSRKKIKDLLHECLHLELDASGRLTGFAPKPDCVALQEFDRKYKH